MKKYVIFSEMETSQNQGDPCFWSDKDGWTTLQNATVYTEEGMDNLADGEKMYLPESVQ